MTYTLSDLEALESFFQSKELGKGFDMVYKSATIEITQDYISERIRLMKLNAAGPKNESYGEDWYDILLRAKEVVEKEVNLG